MSRLARSPKQIGSILRQQRRSMKLTQGQLSGLIGLRQATISEIESGHEGGKLSTILSMLAGLKLEFQIVQRSQGADLADLFDDPKN